jgi:hypothetical protein
MRTALVFGVTFAAGALFFACAKGDEGVAADGGGGGDVTEDGGAGDGAKDGNTSYVADSGKSGDSATADDAEADAAPICVESDAGCSTGSPGACADGILHCDGGVAVCEAVTTTESCYSGGVSTRNTGICHDGTQTCTGTLGACTGEVDPMPTENCFNNTDDDCDGLINNGCPTSLTLGPQRSLASAGTGTGGGAHTVVCPAGAFVTRVDSWFDNNDAEASGVSIYCATPTLIQGASSYTVTLAANTPAPYLVEHGTNDPAIERTDDCGISGLTATHRSITQADSHVEGEGYHCASSTVTFDSTANSIAFDFTPVVGDNNSYATFSGGTVSDQSCSSLEVLVGFTVRDGAYMDNITPICAQLKTVYSAGTPDP